MDVKLSVIIPTIGRESLGAALDSCDGADEIVMVVDEAGGTPDPPESFRRSEGRLSVKTVYVKGGDHGYTARTAGMRAATGTHLAFLDDDDVYAPGAIELFKQHASDVPVIFRMDHYSHGILWKEPVLEFGNVSTQMFVVPNDPERLGTWAPHAPGLREPGGDFTFLRGCVEKMGGPSWRGEIVAVLRPDFPALTVVTAWQNHPELLTDYLAAVSELGPRDRVIIVDNSTSSLMKERPFFPPRWKVITKGENLGFCRGNNTGLAQVETPYVLFLNNDILASRHGWVDTLREQLEPGVLVGASLRYDPHANVDGTQMPYLDGWCLAGPTAELRELGGWPEELAEPAYYSDNVLSLRARAAGMTLREVSTGLTHLLGVTSGANRGVDCSAVTIANRDVYLTEARGLLVEA